MNYMKIEKESVTNGIGLRTVLWLSGCSRHCEGCQNPETWEPDNGRRFGAEAESELADALGKPYIAGLTLTGGDPLDASNADGVLALLRKVRRLFPSKSVWLYTGFRWEDALEDGVRREILSLCDVAVDGEYVETLRNVTLKWRGSANQRVIDARRSLEQGRAVVLE